MVEQERQRLEQLTAGWDDPTQVDWGPDEGDTIIGAPEGDVEVVQQPPIVDVTIEPSQTYKCIALYNYTVSYDLHMRYVYTGRESNWVWQDVLRDVGTEPRWT